MLTHEFNFEKILDLIPCWSWSELRYGLEQNIIFNCNIVSYAKKILVEGIEKFNLVLKMSIVDEDEAYGILVYLSENEEVQEEYISNKWVFALVLYAYIYKRSNVFEIIDDLYSEFGYPEELKKLIGYMPSEDGRSMDDKLEEYIIKWKKIYINKN